MTHLIRISLVLLALLFGGLGTELACIKRHLPIFLRRGPETTPPLELDYVA